MKKQKDEKVNKRQQKINSKIIKLIRQKKYPLHTSNRSPLLFPKIKEKPISSNHQSQNNIKKYIEINLEEENALSGNGYRTDIEHQLMHKCKQNSNKKDKEIVKFQQILFNRLQKLDQNTKNNKKTIHQRDRTSQRRNYQTDQNRYSSCHQHKIKQNFNNINFTLQQHHLLQQQHHNHHQTMSKIKQQIIQQKMQYLSKINMTDYIEPSKDKQNTNLQFIVNQLQNSRNRQSCQKVKKTAYSSISPNDIQSYMQLFKKKQIKAPNLWQQFQQSQAIKQKVHQDEQRSTHLIKTCPDENTTIVQQESQIKQQNILSAKYRLKINHKKIIQINKKTK